jgi:hypothetical protein
MARNPFDFLDQGSRERTLLVLLLALIRKSGGELELTIPDLVGISDGDSFIKYPADTGTSLVLRYARKGAEAFFLTEQPSPNSPSSQRSTQATRTSTPPQPLPSPATWDTTSPTDPSTVPSDRESPPSASSPARHAMHEDLNYSLLEEEMAQRSAAAQRRRNQQARAAEGALPWRTVKPQ